MSDDERPANKGWIDPDEAPELTAADFDRAEIREGETIPRRSRLPAAPPKRSGADKGSTSQV